MSRALDRIEDLIDGPAPPGIEIRAVTDENFDRVRDFRDEGTECYLLMQSIAGEPTVYAWMDGRVVGHFTSIRALHGPQRLGTGIDLQQGDALLDFGNVREDLRGRGIFQAMIRAQTKALFADPRVHRVLTDVAVDSPASLAAHTKCGFRAIADLDYLRVFNVVLRRRLSPATASDSS